MSWQEYGLSKYSDYFSTDHWRALKEDLLWKRNAQCYVCHRWGTLLIHHVKYSSLYKEKVNQDIYILCYDCHNRVHFWGPFRWKVPLTTNWLLFSMRSRRMIYCVQYHMFGRALGWFFIICLIGLFNISIYSLKSFFILLAKTVSYITKGMLS